MNARGVARLGMLAIGIGIGVAVSSPPLASADTSTDSLWWLSDLGLSSAAPQVIVEPNLAISFDGYSLLPNGTATANTTPGEFGLAIAYGSGAHADASGGFGDFASANGTDSIATTAGFNGIGGGSYDVAVAQGTGSYAEADNGYLNAAFANGANAEADAGGNTGGTAGIGDVASASGTGSEALANQGDFNTALTNGTHTLAESGAGNGNLASAVDLTGAKGSEAFSDFGNGNVSSVWGDQSIAQAGGQDSNILGDHDIATAIGDNSGAFSGASPFSPGSYDLGAVLFENGGVSNDATGGDYLYDIVTALGNESGTAAATGGSSFLSELASLF